LSTNEQFQLSGEAAERYERCGARYILGPCAPSLVNAARLSAGERVLDVACGTGVVTRIAAERVGPAGRAVGIDLNPGMIAVARSLPAPNGAPIEWLERSALDLGLEDASFEAVLCQQGLQFFPDKALCASRHVPTKEDLQRLATEGGFANVEVRIDRIDIHLPRIAEFTLEHLAGSPVAQSIAAAPPDARAKVAARVTKQLQRYADGDGVTYPEETQVLTARVQ
jgi:SAM-dependent methyltransferase